MSKLSKEKKERLMLVALASLMVIGLLYTFVIGAQKATLNDLQLKTDGLVDKVSKAKLLMKLGDRIEQDLIAARKTLDARESGMAPADKNRWFFNTVITYMQDHGVNYETSTPEPLISDVGIFPAFPFTAATFGVRATGKFHDFGSFVADFENKFPYMRFSGIRMEPWMGTRAGLPRAGAARTNNVAEPTGLLMIDLRAMTLVKPST